RTLQVGARKVTPLQADTGEIGARKIGAPHEGAGEARATKVGTRQIGAREIAPIEARAAEHTAATVVGRLGEECRGVLRSGTVGGGRGQKPRQTDAQDGSMRAHDLLRPGDNHDKLSRMRSPAIAVPASPYEYHAPGQELGRC